MYISVSGLYIYIDIYFRHENKQKCFEQKLAGKKTFHSLKDSLFEYVFST